MHGKDVMWRRLHRQGRTNKAGPVPDRADIMIYDSEPVAHCISDESSWNFPKTIDYGRLRPWPCSANNERGFVLHSLSRGSAARSPDGRAAEAELGSQRDTD